jgi:hypothetical protein
VTKSDLSQGCSHQHTGFGDGGARLGRPIGDVESAPRSLKRVRSNKLSTLKWLWTGLLVLIAVTIIGAPQALAEPLTPGEVQYLAQIRRVFAANHDPVAFRSDGELLVDGRYACDRRANGYVGSDLLTPAVTQLAFVYLCPR